MTSWLHRHLGVVFGAFGLFLIGAFVWIALLMSQMQETQKDLDRVEAGAALFAGQVQGFQKQLSDLAPEVSAGLDEAIAGLESFGTSTIEFSVPIDENVQFTTDVVINKEIQVPIKTTLPINESFKTTIKIAGPFGTEIPLNVTVPVNIEVPIDLVCINFFQFLVGRQRVYARVILGVCLGVVRRRRTAQHRVVLQAGGP